MLKKFLNYILIFLFLCINLLYPISTFAESDFEIISDYTLEYTKGDEILVKDYVTFRVNNERYFLQPGLEQTFFLKDYSKVNVSREREYKLKTLVVQNQSSIPLKYSKKYESDGINITIKIPQKINPFEDYTIEFSYKTHDLVNISGNIINMYVPGLAKNTKFQSTGDFGLKTEYLYNTKIITPNTLPLPSYTQPSNIKYTEKNDFRIFNIDAKDRIGQVGWMQFGNSQYYKFKLVQESKKTDKITPEVITDIAPIVSTNIYKIALPREYDETNQKVDITSINPKPTRLERDFDGNLIAVFEVLANKDSNIEIQGIISLSLKDINEKEKFEDINLSTYKEELHKLTDKEKYLSEDKYWQISDDNIQTIASELYGKSTTILDLIRNNYNYIVNTFEYSDDKLSGENNRLGAQKALSGSPAICMEYSDSLTALFRAQGIPARVAIGYGNDPLSLENNIKNDKLNEQLIGHQWTQVWIPNYGWLSVDPTWGESQRTYIGSDLDHILWYTQSSSAQNITDAIFYSAEFGEIGSHKVYLQALNKEQADEEIKNNIPLSLFNLTQSQSQENLDFYIKTSLIGRLMIYVLPIVITLIISSIITSVIYTIKNRVSKSKNKDSIDQVHS